MNRRTVLVALVALLIPTGGFAQLVAERVTASNASARLFGGTDADGGVGDWYLSNGVVEAIIDDVGPQPDLVPLLGAAAPPIGSEFAFTGGALIDLGLKGRNNDQLSQVFTVGGLSTSNFILYSSVSTARTPSSATIRVSGPLLGFDGGASPVDPEDLPVVTEYTVHGDDPFLTVTTSVENRHPTNTAAGLGGFLDAAIWTLRAVVPFSPLPNRGFNHPVLDFSNLIFALELPAFSAGPGSIEPADGVMDTQGGTGAGEVSYGLLGVEASIDQDGGGPTPPVVVPVDTLFGVSSNLVTALGNSPLGSLAPGGTLTYTRRIYVGGRNDVASVANPMITELGGRRSFAVGTISGDVDARDTADVAASVIVTRSGGSTTPGFDAGAPVTHFRTDPTGAFSGVVLPAGVYSLEVRAPERDAVVVSGVQVNEGAETTVSVPSLTGLGTLELNVVEISGAFGAPVPARVTIKGMGETPDPNFGRDFDALALFAGGGANDLLPETFGGGPAHNFVYLADGSATVQLRPGRYEVIATRGLEYTAARRKVRVKEGVTRTARLKIERLVDTDGFVSADFHIHSARSMDASAPPTDRVVSFAGEGVEVMVSTDHDFHLDYAPLIASLGYDDRMTSIIGNEVTGSVPNPPAFPDSIGHLNGWPVPVAPSERRDGAIEDEFVAPNFIYTRLRRQGAEVIQYNHPRAGVSGLTSIGIFNNFGYDPDLPLTASPNNLLLDDDVLGPGLSGVKNPDGFRNLDFDVMEIGNGIEVPAYIAMRRDWFSLLNQTDFETVPFIGGTGVSDSHRVTMEHAGYFRTYVGGAGDDPGAVNVGVFDRNVKAGNMMATTGPFIEFSIESGRASAGLGETFTPIDGLVLNVRVQATSWIPVEEVRVYANGFLVMTFDEKTSPAVRPAPRSPFSRSPTRVMRFDARIPVSVSADTYFVVEAGARLDPLPVAPPFIETILPEVTSGGVPVEETDGGQGGMVPIGFTNPIFVDLDGDGFDPPGLPVMASATGRGEPLPAFARVSRRDLSAWARLRSRWSDALVAARSWGAVVATDRKAALTGRDLQAEVERQKSKPTADYFPLYRFSIPEEVVDQALEQLPEPERSRIRELRRRNR